MIDRNARLSDQGLGAFALIATDDVGPIIDQLEVVYHDILKLNKKYRIATREDAAAILKKASEINPLKTPVIETMISGTINAALREKSIKKKIRKFFREEIDKINGAKNN